MTTDKILASIDSEITLLRQARALLSSDGTKNTTAAAPVRKKRKMSAAAKENRRCSAEALGEAEVYPYQQIGRTPPTEIGSAHK
jgi:hypothetical protein